MMTMMNTSIHTLLSTTHCHPAKILYHPLFLLPPLLLLIPKILLSHKPFLYPPLLPDLHVPHVPRTGMAMSYHMLRSHVDHTMLTTQHTHKPWLVPMQPTGVLLCKWNLIPLFHTVLEDSSNVLPRPTSWVVCGDSSANATLQEPLTNTRLVG